MKSEPQPTVELRTERLLLRPFQIGDVDDIAGMGGFPTWDGSGPNPYTRKHAEELIARKILDSWQTHPSFATVMDDAVMGHINVKVQREDRTATIGYSIKESHWGKGIASEATWAVISWIFRELGLAKVSATADVLNTRSWRVMEKLGMTREGLSRSDKVIHGERTAMVWYGILFEEWEASDRGPP